MSALVVRGDAGRLPLPDESVDLIVTSPPYFALRSYTDGGEHYAGQLGSSTAVPTSRSVLAATRAVDRTNGAITGGTRMSTLGLDAGTRTITGYACACTPYTDHPERRGKSFHDHSRDRDAGGTQDSAGRWAAYMDPQAGPSGPVREYHFDQWTPAPTRPAVVLDPFGGTGTTAHVADALGRTGITVDLSADYCRLAAAPELRHARRRKALGLDKPPPPVAGPEQGDLFGDLMAGPYGLPS